MNLRTAMQAGPMKANELFARLSENSDGAVKTREKLFGDLKAELELHTNLEEQHLFPILRRHAETKEIVTDAIKENKELRAKLAEIDGLPKNDEAFLERLKELQKSFRQHARDEKRELLPAVQQALSEEQVQRVADKIEAGVAEAEQAKRDEVEERRLKARQEREQAERQVEQQVAAERAQKAAAAQARHEAAEQQQAKAQEANAQAERQANQDAAAQRAKDAAERGLHDAAEAVAQTAMTAQRNVVRMVETTVDAARSAAPDLSKAVALPNVALKAMTDIHTAWMEWIGQTMRAGTQMSQTLVRQAAQQQQHYAADSMQRLMHCNAHVMRITMDMAQQSARPFMYRVGISPHNRRSDQ